MKNAKNTKAIVTLTKSLTAIAGELGATLLESNAVSKKLESLSATVGTYTRKAGLDRGMTEARIDLFVETAIQHCIDAGMQAESLAVYKSNMRGVIRSMLTLGYRPAEGLTLRVMYRDRIKAEGTKSGARTGNAADTPTPSEAAKAPSEAAKAPSESDARQAAIRLLFGSYDAELDAAVRWANSNLLSFTRYVKANLTAGATPAASAKPAAVKRAKKKAA